MMLLPFMLAASLPATPASTAADIRALRTAATCLIRKNRVAAADFAFTPPGSPEEASAADSLKELPSCAKGLGYSRVADAVAMHLFVELVMSQSEWTLSSDEQRANAFLPQGEGKPSEEAVLNCIAQLKPAATGAFIRSRPNSRQESVSLNALLQLMPKCIPAGAEVRWSPSNFRLGLARSVYRNSAAREAVRRGF